MMLLYAAALAMGQPVTKPVLLSQSQLDAISDQCKTPRDWLVRRQDAIELRTGLNATDAQSACIFGELKRLNAGPLGFTGNDVEP